MSGSVTLVDAMVVITGYEQDWFAGLARAVPLGVAGQVLREASFYVRDDGVEVPINLGSLIHEGALRLEHASVGELAKFAAACLRSGLGTGEIESITLTMSRGYGFCTADIRAMRALNDLGLRTQWRALEELFEMAGLDAGALRPEFRRGAWR